MVAYLSYDVLHVAHLNIQTLFISNVFNVFIDFIAVGLLFFKSGRSFLALKEVFCFFFLLFLLFNKGSV